MIEKAMILAAGKGTRMWPLTDNTPKPLLPLGGTTIIQRQIEELTKAGVKEIHVLIGYQMKAISNHLGNGKKLGVKIKYILQEKQEGTGHAVLQANGKIKGGFYCLNGDMIIDGSNLDRMSNGKNEIVMMTTEVEDGSKFGVVQSKKGKLVSITEKGVSGKADINAGMYLFNEKIFEAIKGVGKSVRGEYELTDALQAISKDVNIMEYKGFWKDIGCPWDLITANENCIEDIEEKRHGIIEDNVNINGKIHVGKNSIIKSGTCTEGTVWIGENCVVGPNAYLRGGTVLCGDNKVGASSEIKNTILMLII